MKREQVTKGNARATIEWYEGYANKPKLVIYEDVVSDFVYEQRGNCYFAVDHNTGHVSFFYYAKPGDGYGGTHFHIRMKDGSEKTLIGPWSSRCEVMNQHGFPHSVEVIIRKPGREYGGLSGALLIDKAREWLALTGEPVEYRREGDVYVIHKLEETSA